VPAAFRRAGPCRPAGLAGSPGTAWWNGPGRPGHASSRAGPCLGRAKKPGHVPGYRALGCMLIYSRRTYAPLPNRSAPSLARWVLYWCGIGVRGGVPDRGESVKQFMNSTGPGQRREGAPNTAPAVSGQTVGLKWRPFPAFPTGREDRWLVSMLT
jgi:hypothetical protein